MRMANPSGFALLQKKAPLVGAFFMGVIWHFPALAFCPLPEQPQQVQVRQVEVSLLVSSTGGSSGWISLLFLSSTLMGQEVRPNQPRRVEDWLLVTTRCCSSGRTFWSQLQTQLR